MAELSTPVVAAATIETERPAPKGRSLWKDAMTRLKRDRVAIVCLWIIIFYALIALAAKLDLIAHPWDDVVGQSYQPPSFESLKLIFGTDIFGRSVFYKVIHGTRIAMSVGLVSAMISVPIDGSGNAAPPDKTNGEKLLAVSVIVLAFISIVCDGMIHWPPS